MISYLKKTSLLSLAISLLYISSCGGGGSTSTAKKASNPKTKELRKPTTVSSQRKSMSFRNDRGFLWTFRNGNTTVYLTGGTHLVADDFYPLPDYMLKAIAESDEYAKEIHVNPSDSELLKKHQEAQERYGSLSFGKTLKDEAGEVLYSKIEEFYKITGETPNNKMSLRSFQIGLHHALWPVLSQKGVVADGIDGKLTKVGQENQKKIVSLEGLERWEIFSSPVIEKDIREIHQLLDFIISDKDPDQKLAEVTEYFSECLQPGQEAWKAGDIDFIENKLHEDMRDVSEETYHLMLTKRNRVMANKILSLLDIKREKEHKIFACVGIFHLVGQGSIIQMLQEAGYTLQG